MNGGVNPLIQQKLSGLNKKKAEVEAMLDREKRNSGYLKATKDELLQAFRVAQDILENGEFETKREVIGSFVNKVLVFQNHVEIYINTIPHAHLGGIDINVDNKLILNTDNSSDGSKQPKYSKDGSNGHVSNEKEGDLPPLTADFPAFSIANQSLAGAAGFEPTHVRVKV